MPKTVETTVYLINELEGEAKEKALDHFRYANVDDDFWHECLTHIPKNGQYKSDFQIQAEEKGFNMTRFYFSGFSSQGDGACFAADVDYEEYILKNKLGNKYRTLLNHVRRDGGGLTITGGNNFYVHSNTMHVDGYDHYFDAADDTKRAWDAADKADSQAEDLADRILEHARDLANDFYRTLEKEYEYLTSDEQVEESLLINEIPFLADGTPF